MKKDTLQKLLSIVETAVNEGSVVQLEWLVNFFQKQVKTNKEIEDLLTNNPTKKL